jgi:hypothetical protein
MPPGHAQHRHQVHAVSIPSADTLIALGLEQAQYCNQASEC